MYSRDLNQEVDAKKMTTLLDQFVVTRKVLHEAFAKVEKIYQDLPEIDQIISSSSKEYDFKRISSVELNVLRLAIYELKFEGRIPPKVAITEAIRLTQRFGTPEGGGFVNAVLDAIFQLEKISCPLKAELSPTSP